MAIPLSWKIGAGALAAILLVAVWSLASERYAEYQADQITQEAAHVAQQNAQQAQEQARQYHAKLAENLKQRREALYNNYQQINDQARQYQKAQAIRLEKEQQEKLRVEQSYVLGSHQQCVGGIVIDRQGASFSQAKGKSGNKIECRGSKAVEPLR